MLLEEPPSCTLQVKPWKIKLFRVTGSNTTKRSKLNSHSMRTYLVSSDKHRNTLLYNLRNRCYFNSTRVWRRNLAFVSESDPYPISTSTGINFILKPIHILEYQFRNKTRENSVSGNWNTMQNMYWQWNQSSMYNNSLITVCPLFIHIFTFA